MGILRFPVERAVVRPSNEDRLTRPRHSSSRQRLSVASGFGCLSGPCSRPAGSGLPDDDARWGTGFQLASPPTQPMLGSGSFGHAGAGGRLAFADAEHGVGFAYLGNQMGGYGDVRARELTLALGRVVGA